MWKELITGFTEHTSRYTYDNLNKPICEESNISRKDNDINRPEKFKPQNLMIQGSLFKWTF